MVRRDVILELSREYHDVTSEMQAVEFDLYCIHVPSSICTTAALEIQTDTVQRCYQIILHLERSNDGVIS